MATSYPTGLIPATKSNPCPHCGKPDWCYSVGNYSVCQRDQPPATGWQATDKCDKDGKVYYELTPEKKATRPAATRHWTYLDRAGNPLVRVNRTDDGAGGKPNWYQLKYNAQTGCWERGTEGITREDIPIYRYTEVRKAIAAKELIFIVEGESCVDILWNLGLAATCNIGGSKKWRASDTKDLNGAKVVIGPDRDKPGVEHAELLNKEFPDAQWLYAYPDSRAWFNLPNSQGLDVRDWIDSWKNSCAPIDRAVIMASVGAKKVLAVTATPQTVTATTKSDLSVELDNIIAQNLKPSDRELAIAVLASTHKLQVSVLQSIITKKEAEALQADGLEDLGAELIRLSDSSDKALNLSEFLPEIIAAPIVSLAKKMNLKPELYLLCLLVQSAALLPAKTSTLLHEPTNYRVKPNYYGAGVAESGQKKTPVTKAICCYPMEDLEDKARSDFDGATAVYETELAKWKATKKDDKGPAPTLPVRKVYAFNGATGEAIPAQANRCPNQSLLFLTDELAGMFKSANKYSNGRGSDDEDLLEYWSGGGKKILRKDGLTVDVKDVNLSIFGNIQPDVLAKFIGDGSDDNGKFARFDFVYQPITSTHLSMKDTPCTLTPTLSKLYAYLDSLENTQFELSVPAQENFVKFYNWCDDRRGDETRQGIRAMIAKMPEKVGKLATILHCIKAYESGKPPNKEIDFETIRAAAKFAGYCRKQVESLNAQIITPGALAPSLLKILELAKRKGGTVTGREVFQSSNSKYRPTSQQIKEYFSELVALKYGNTTFKGASVSFSLGDVSTVSTLGYNVDSVKVPGVDTVVHTESTVSTLLKVLDTNSLESVDKCGLSVDTVVHTFKPISDISLSASVDSVDLILPTSEISQALPMSRTTPDTGKNKKTPVPKRPIAIGDEVTIAYSDIPAYRGIKGKVIAERKMADGLKGFKVEFVKAVRGILNDLFSPGDLMRN